MFSISPRHNTKRKSTLSPAKSRLFNTAKSASVFKKETIPRLYDLPKIPSYYQIDRSSLGRGQQS
jgi:hypothetical protein